MEKFWNFYDWFGVCVWSQPYMNGDTVSSMRQWWDEFIRDEEYQPEVTAIELEDYNGEDN